MTILDLLLFMVGLAGVGFMIYAFSVIKLFKTRERWLGISLLMLLLVLVSDRIFSPNDSWNFPDILPAPQQDSRNVTDQPFQKGWEDIPYVIAPLLSGDFGNFDGAAPVPSSPLPSITPSSPTPALPSPKPWPSIALPPPRPVDPDPIPTDPTPADPTPVDPTPTDPTPPARPSPRPSAPPIAPRSPNPVPAWW